MTLPPILSNIPFLKTISANLQKAAAEKPREKIQDFPSDKIELSAAAVEKQKAEAEIRATAANARKELESTDVSLGLDPAKLAG